MKKAAEILIWILIAMIAAMVVLSLTGQATAEDFYVLCRPEAEVNIRERPKLKSPIVACYFFGDQVKTDGEEKNGFLHVTDIQGEVSDGWIYKGLLVNDPPVATTGAAQVFSDGRVACRKYASTDAKIQRWLQDGSNVRIFAISEIWCVTEYGYIKTEFLTVNAPARAKKM